MRATGIDYERVFDLLPTASVLVANDSPRYTILDLNQAFQKATHIERSAIGKGLFEVFTDDPEMTEGVPEVRAAVDQAVRTAKPVAPSLLKFSLPASYGGWEVYYWEPRLNPVLDSRGNVLCVILSTVDVTKTWKLQDRNARMAESLELILQSLRDTLPSGGS